MPEELSIDQVRKVAALARLRLSDERAEEYGRQLVAILSYVEMLRELDLDGVEPLSTPGDVTNRLDDDQPGETLSPDVLLSMLPESIRAEGGVLGVVPRVLGEGGGGA